MASKRLSQVEANYGHGDPITNCGICAYYQGAITKRCTQVMGNISPFGVSDVFKVAPNPFGTMLSPNEKTAIKAMAADAQDRSGGGGGAMQAPGAPSQPQAPAATVLRWLMADDDTELPPWMMGQLAAQDNYAPDPSQGFPAMQPPAPPVTSPFDPRNDVASMPTSNPIASYAGQTLADWQSHPDNTPTSLAQLKALVGRPDDPQWNEIASLGMGLGGTIKNVGGKTPLPKFPQYAEEYPPVGPGVPTIDPKKGTPYMAKANTPDALAFQKERRAIIDDMAANGYAPYFDPAQRFHADPTQYPAMLDTAQHLPVKAETILKWTNELDTPETRAALQQMYKVGETVPNAQNWYMMGQLEREYIKEYGPTVGREQFRNRFGGAMAATTGGADPTANLLMAHYSNFLANKGEDFPRVTAAENTQVKELAESQGKEYVDKKGRPIDKTGEIASYKVPFPVGGQYAATNLDTYKRVFDEVAAGKDIGQALSDANPKRLDFMQSFTGHPDSFTWDKQMTEGATAGKYEMPPGNAYGVLERVAREEAAKAPSGAVPAQNFQDVGWAGQKAMLEGAKPLPKPYQGPSGPQRFQYEGPMISHVNDAIERTHRLTGMSRQEIVRRGLVRAEIPLYGLGAGVLAPGVMGALADQSGYREP